MLACAGSVYASSRTLAMLDVSRFTMQMMCGLSVQVKFVKSNTLAMARIQVEKLICIEKFENVPQLGRFTLRDEGRTIAIGKIERLPKSARA